MYRTAKIAIISSATNFFGNFVYFFLDPKGDVFPIISITVASIIVSMCDGSTIIRSGRVSVDNKSVYVAAYIKSKIASFFIFSFIVPIVYYIGYGDYYSAAIGVIVAIPSVISGGPYLAYAGFLREFMMLSGVRIISPLLFFFLLNITGKDYGIILFVTINWTIIFCYIFMVQKVIKFSRVNFSASTLIKYWAIDFYVGTSKIPFLMYMPLCSAIVANSGEFVYKYIVEFSKIDLYIKILAGFSGPVPSFLSRSVEARNKLFIASGFFLKVIFGNIIFLFFGIFYFDNNIAILIACYMVFFAISVAYGNGLAVQIKNEKNISISNNIFFVLSFCFFYINPFGLPPDFRLIYSLILNELLNAFSRVIFSLQYLRKLKT